MVLWFGLSTGKGIRDGKILTFMKGHGLKEKCMGRANLLIPIKMCMRDNSIKIRLMDSVFIPNKVEKSMKACGLMINHMVKANKHLQMVPYMKENSKTEPKKNSDYLK